jgi:hypothetical protein
MNRRLPIEDTQPWYKQFWPWVLILLPATVVVAGLTTVFIANRHADDLVVDEYYKDGLAINRQLEKKQRAQALGISVQLHFGEAAINVHTTGPIAAGELTLLMSHPLEADRDFSIILSRLEPGVYSGNLPQPIAPRWHWTLELAGEQGWRLDGSVQASDLGNASAH